jgi:hypothetical protein
LLWARVRTGLNRLRRSTGGLSSGDEDVPPEPQGEPEAHHEPEGQEEPQVEPEAQQEPQIEAEVPAGPQDRPGVEPEPQVPQPEPRAEAGSAAGPTEETRQKPQPKVAGKSPKKQRGPKSPPAATPLRKSPRITKTGEPLVRSVYVAGKPIAVPYTRTHELTPPVQAEPGPGAGRGGSPESTTCMQLPTSGAGVPGGPPLSASGLAALARAAARAAAAAAPPPGSSGLTLLAEAATSAAAPVEPLLPAGAPADVPPSSAPAVGVPASAPEAGVPPASVPQVGVPASAPEAGAPPASAPEAGAHGLAGLPHVSSGVPAAQESAGEFGWADTGSPRQEECEEGEWIEEWEERKDNGLVVTYRAIVNEYGDEIKKRMVAVRRESGHVQGRDVELERYQSIIDGTYVHERFHDVEGEEGGHDEPECLGPSFPMQWRKTKFRIGYRAFSSDRSRLCTGS